MTTATTAAGPKPAATVRLGAIQAAIWRNTDDENRTRYGVTLERIYRDQDGNWKSTHSFGRDELLTLAKVADLANSRIHELQAEDRAPDRNNNREAPSPAAQQKGGRTR